MTLQKDWYLKREAIEFTDPETKYCKITFRGSGENAGGYININKYYPVLAGSTAVMELTTPVRLEVELVISAESTLKFDEIEIEELSQPYYLASECSGAKDVLVVVPNYPSFANLYLCAFAHSISEKGNPYPGCIHSGIQLVRDVL